VIVSVGREETCRLQQSISSRSNSRHESQNNSSNQRQTEVPDPQNNSRSQVEVLVAHMAEIIFVESVLSSTRVELVGIAAPNKFLFHFMKYYKIESMSKVMKCVNNRAAISFVNQTQGPHSCSRWYSNDIDTVPISIFSRYFNQVSLQPNVNYALIYIST
jgi:hypothetical protein